MRVLFLVQGEGRGHLTQALALAPMLRRAGHTVSAALVGTDPSRRLPAFFLDGLGAPVERFVEPSFAYGRRGLDPAATAARTLRRLPGLARAGSVVRQAIARHRPDIVVNFYTVAGGRLGGAGVPVVCVGHQYLFHHPAYPFPARQRTAQAVARAWTEATVPPGARRLALSFYPAEPLPGRNLRVVPPLLRDGVFARPTRDDGSLLVYLMHPAAAPAIEAWAAAHPETPVHVFGMPDGATPDAPSVTFHRLDGERFLDAMARCRAVVCTAGFESVCEAMAMGKPALMVPLAGHVEQRCNARDAVASGAGLYAPTLDATALDALLEMAPHLPDAMRAWAAGAEAVFIDEIERAAGRRRWPVGGDGATHAVVLDPVAGMAA